MQLDGRCVVMVEKRKVIKEQLKTPKKYVRIWLTRHRSTYVLYVCTYLHTYVRTYVRIYVHTYIHTLFHSGCTYSNTYYDNVHMYVYMYIIFHLLYVFLLGIKDHSVANVCFLLYYFSSCAAVT